MITVTLPDGSTRELPEGSSAADLAGIDVLLLASLVLLGIAVLPSHRLRESEHLVGARVEVAKTAETA